MATDGGPRDDTRAAGSPVMKHALLALALSLSSCTVIGAAAGVGVGYFAGSPGTGAAIGAMLGLRCDLELRDMFRKLHVI